jgi:hypothetical protein
MANGEGGFWAGKVGLSVVRLPEEQGPGEQGAGPGMGPGAVAKAREQWQRPRLKSVLPWKYELV